MTRLIPLLILLLIWASPAMAWVRSATIPARCTTHATDCTALTCATSNDGDMCCELDDDTVYFCDGAEGSYVTSAAASGDITSVWSDDSGDVSALTGAAGDTLNCTSADSCIPWTVKADCSGETTEGFGCWDNDGDALCIGTGAACTANINGNAATATALAADPSDCAANTFANAIAASGNLTCVTVDDLACTDCVEPTDLGDDDFGDFTCSAGDACTLDTGTVADNEIDYTNVTCADITMSDCDEDITTTGDFVTNNASPALQMKDSDAAAGDVSVRYGGNCTDTDDGSEDCDAVIQVQEAGAAAETRFQIDADGGVTLGSANNNSCTCTTDGTGDAEFVVPNDSVGENEIDFANVTCADITTTDCGPITSTGANTIGDGSAAVTINATTGVELTTSATECIMLDAAGITCLDTGGCTDPADTDGTNFSFKTAAFATGADDCGSWAFELPDNMTGTTASVTFIWFSDHSDCDGGAEDEVCWTIDGDSFADDAAFESGALGGTLVGITSDICTADGDIMRSAAVTFTHSMAASQTAVVLVCRDVDGGSCTGDDDYGQDAKLRAVKFCYEVSNANSGE